MFYLYTRQLNTFSQNVISRLSLNDPCTDTKYITLKRDCDRPVVELLVGLFTEWLRGKKPTEGHRLSECPDGRVLLAENNSAWKE